MEVRKLEISRALPFQCNLPFSFLLPHISYIDISLPFQKEKHLMNFFLARNLLIFILNLLVAYVRTQKYGKDKFQLRAQVCVFVGYPISKKAYKVLDFGTNQIYTTRDIIFHQEIFPFHLESWKHFVTWHFHPNTSQKPNPFFY